MDRISCSHKRHPKMRESTNIISISDINYFPLLIEHQSF